MIPSESLEIIRRHCRPLAAQPTDTEPRLMKLPGIRAVLFDVYGTLFISASGDIGANAGAHRAKAVAEVAEVLGLSLSTSPEQAVDMLHAEIARDHAAHRSEGIEYPEVDIVAIWQKVAPQIFSRMVDQLDCQRLALEYEVRVNPVWPMPRLEETLESLEKSDVLQGIVSNAQFFTPLLFPAFLGKSAEELGFERELSYFSYEYSQAKPGTFLYERVGQTLADREISPAEVLYVGNDMLNDMMAASQVGFRTALFAGDRRSLRWRDGDERVGDLTPDVVVTQLEQLLDCIEF